MSYRNQIFNSKRWQWQTTMNLYIVVVFLSTYGLFIGVNGEADNNIITRTNIYRDTRNELKLLSNQTMENVLKMRPGDRISILMYTFNIV